jgi:hypothetical protein
MMILLVTMADEMVTWYAIEEVDDDETLTMATESALAIISAPCWRMLTAAMRKWAVKATLTTR